MNFNKYAEKIKSFFSKQKVKKAVRCSAVVLFAIFVIPLLAFNITIIFEKCLGKNPVSFFGYIPVIVETDEMLPYLNSNTVALFKKDNDVSVIDTGDIVCFFDTSSDNGDVTVRRISGKTTDSSGGYVFNTVCGNSNNNDSFLLSGDNILGVYRFSLKGGGFLKFVQSTAGLLIFAILPLLGFFAYDFIKMRHLKE